MAKEKKGRVVFIGAGPGDPELMTLKGQKLMLSADLILYSGSLLPATLVENVSNAREIVNTARLTLNEQIALMRKAWSEGKTVARLHTGDPSIYGALTEQTQELDALGMDYEIIPGVSSVFAAAAALGIEFTLPELTQSLILTRMNGRTPVPQREVLRSMAAHRSSLALYLSTNLMDRVVEELEAAGYPPETPIAVVYRASWPDQRILRGTLEDIQVKLDAEEITHQGLVIVSPALSVQKNKQSHLYSSYQNHTMKREGVQIFALTKPAAELGKTLVIHLPNAELNLPSNLIFEAAESEKIMAFTYGFREALQSAFRSAKAIICIMASGIVVRELAPLLTDKHTDPAVLVTDVSGQFVVSLLGGHEAGANQLAEKVALLTGGQAVITTASDQKNLPALDLIAQKQGWLIGTESNLAGIMRTFVDEEPVTLFHESTISLPKELLDLPWAAIQELTTQPPPRAIPQAVVLSHKVLSPDLLRTLIKKVLLIPKILSVGIGCNRGCPLEELEDALAKVLADERLSMQSVACLASIKEKSNETGLLALSNKLAIPLCFYNHEQIEALGNVFSPSPAAQKALGVSGVAEPCAMLGANTNQLLVSKRKFPNVTIALALMKGLK
ncbi:MAG: precorrin-4 C(11)-methyltransferase [Anaerolineaceae bacterium]|nr:precorrin-4 C(11)-methyltransferase [Anaerolineaceae bacterium]